MRLRILILTVAAVFAAAAPLTSYAAARKSPPQTTASLTNTSFDTNIFDYDTPDDRNAGRNARGAGSVFFSVVKSLFVIALLVAAGWVVIRWLSRKQFNGEIGSDAFRVVARHSIAPGRTLCIVRILESYSVLAFSESGVSVVREITDHAELEKVRAMERDLPSGTDRPPDFTETLSQALKSAGQAFPGAGGQGRSSDRILAFLRKQKDKLSNLNGGKKP